MGNDFIKRLLQLVFRRNPPEDDETNAGKKTEHDAPVRAPVTEQDAPVHAPVAEQDTPVHTPVTEQDTPIRAPVTEQDAPVHAPVADQDTPVHAPVTEQDTPRDIYISIMMPEVKAATEDDINSTVSSILSVVDQSEFTSEEVDPEWEGRRTRIIATCKEILESIDQIEKRDKIADLLRQTSGLTSTALFSIRLKEMLHSWPR
ncbi:MAG: hypothetical protein SVM79_03730 [Chloroflexota bacterium]|nr:hypothetical protein [Chloroflexota bacterium]